jgi:hypothetical protein
VVTREDAPPPIATTLIRLTQRGEQLRPVLDGLTHWGVPLMVEQKPDDAVRSHWLAAALELMLTDRRPDSAPVTIGLRTGDQPITMEIRDGLVRTRFGEGESADATLAGPPNPIMGVLLGQLDVADAESRGVTFQGDPAILDRIGANRTPAPAPS